jgi:hypothetical protein
LSAEHNANPMNCVTANLNEVDLQLSAEHDEKPMNSRTANLNKVKHEAKPMN